jgi:predicted Fe-S protein YdhL (DUF1289 family)
MREACGFCGTTSGPFTHVEGLFEVLMCPGCLRERGRSAGPYPAMSDEEHRAALELLPTWVLEQKATANRALVAAMRQRLAQGQPVARMYQPDGLAWLERQADLAEAIVAARQAARPSSQPGHGPSARGRVCCRDERA